MCVREYALALVYQIVHGLYSWYTHVHFLFHPHGAWIQSVNTKHTYTCTNQHTYKCKGDLVIASAQAIMSSAQAITAQAIIDHALRVLWCIQASTFIQIDMYFYRQARQGALIASAQAVMDHALRPVWRIQANTFEFTQANTFEFTHANTFEFAHANTFEFTQANTFKFTQANTLNLLKQTH